MTAVTMPYRVKIEVTDSEGEFVSSHFLSVKCADLAFVTDRIGELLLESSPARMTYRSEDEEQRHLRMLRGTGTEDDLKYLKPPEDYTPPQGEGNGR